MKYSKHSFTRQYSVLSDFIQANEPRTRSQNLIKIPKNFRYDENHKMKNL